MIERYSKPEMTNIWSDNTKVLCWISIEVEALHAMKNHGVIPDEVDIPTVQIRHRQSQPDETCMLFEGTGTKLATRISLPKFIEDWLVEEERTRHDVVAFIHTLEPYMQDVGRFIHYGMTSSDLCDTEMAMRMGSSLDLITLSVSRLKSTIYARAEEYKESPIVGRTHGMWAEPTSFGLVLLSYVAELKRHLARLHDISSRAKVGKLSGAVGTYAHIRPEIEKDVMEKLGLGIEEVPSQVVNRDRHAEVFNLLALIGATIERLAVEIRHLSRSEVREVSEPFGEKQKGSSAMPHKKNPIGSENMTGMARLLRHYAGAAMENIALWHQRDISHSSVERMIAPDAFGLLYFMLDRMTKMMSGLVVHTDEMLARVEYALPDWRSQMDMLKLISDGSSRKEAHDRIQNKERVIVRKDDEMITYHLRNVNTIFGRM